MSKMRAASMRPFAEFLAGLDRGRVCDELNERLAEVVEAVIEHDKAGSVTLKIAVKPRKGDDGTVDVQATSSCATPKPEHAGVFFFTENFELTRDDPTMAPLISYADAEKGQASHG